MSKTKTPIITLRTLAEQFITNELGIRDSFLSKIAALGIAVETNQAQYPRGMYATTFVLPEKRIVIKFFDKEPETPNIAKLPNQSRYLLQPYCITNILGNRLAIFPLLNTKNVTDSHIKELKNGLKKEGYFFDDTKLENAGLTNNGIPYVIDEDAVFILAHEPKPDLDRFEQWKIIPKTFQKDEKTNLQESGWDFLVKTPSQTTMLREERKLAANTNLIIPNLT